MTTIVKFQLAKLLREKGFDKEAKCYHSDGTFQDRQNLYNYNDSMFQDGEDYLISAPTIAETVTWLYEKYAIWIFVASKTSDGKNIFIPHGRTVPDTIKNGLIVDLIPYTAKDTPTEAYESAIEYCLTNITER